MIKYIRNDAVWEQTNASLPLLPKRKVDIVSASLKLLGLQFTIRQVLLLPPREFYYRKQRR